MQLEVLTLTLSQVDFSAGKLRINPGGSKTGEGRDVCLSAEVRMLVEEQLERVRDFRKSWTSACKTAGLSGMLRHDLRRTAARDLIVRASRKS
jgi:integrase